MSSIANTPVLFVCTGNVCRSPLAEACLRGKLAQALAARGQSDADLPRIDSAATTQWHRDEPPSSLAIRCGEQRGYVMSRMRARPVTTQDFEQFVWIFAMTREHRQLLNHKKPDGASAQIMLFSALAPQLGMRDIPDPWGGDAAAYNSCLDQIEVGCDALVRRMLGAPHGVSASPVQPGGLPGHG